MGAPLLQCGIHCQPTEILAEIQSFGSSTRPARVLTDVGEGFIKGVGNPAGEIALVSELIAAELGTWFGLKIPPFAIVQQCQIEIPMVSHHRSIQPPMFFSSAVEGMPRDGSDIFLRRLTDKQDVARLIVFDTWIRNLDRYGNGDVNSDNLLYGTAQKGRSYDLVPIDHSHCLAEISLDELTDEDVVNDPNIYGFFPEFSDFVTPSSVAVAVNDLSQLSADFVAQCVNSIPPQWGVAQSDAQNLADFICRRANFVVESIAIKLVDNPMMGGI